MADQAQPLWVGTYQLPKGHNDPHTWEVIVNKYKALRLRALQTDPDAFASTYEKESKEPFEFWEDRLKRPKVAAFIALEVTEDMLSMDKETDWAKLVEKEWLGMVVAIGPMVVGEGEHGLHIPAGQSPWEKAKPGPEQDIPARNQLRPLPGQVMEMRNRNPLWNGQNEAQYQLNGFYVVPEARGTKIGSNLLSDAVWSRGDCRMFEPDNWRCIAVVDAENTPAIKTYEKAGFKIVCEDKYIKPGADVFRDGYKERTAYVMDWWHSYIFISPRDPHRYYRPTRSRPEHEDTNWQRNMQP